MPNKQGAKNIPIDGEIHHNFRRAVEAEEFRYGLTAKAEELLKDYAKRVLEKHGLKYEKVEDPILVVEGAPKGFSVRHAKPLGKTRQRQRHTKA